METLIIEQVWTLTLEMWRYVVSEYQKIIDGCLVRNKKFEMELVTKLKQRWLDDNKTKFRYRPDSDCFFCEYDIMYGAGQYSANVACKECPARKVFPNFHCANRAYSYHREPEKFLAVIEALNILRQSCNACLY